MIEYEKQISIYIVKQIFKLFNKLCGVHSAVPKYKIICNFESDMGINQYIFKNFNYIENRPGVKIRGDDLILEEVECEDVIQVTELCRAYELIIWNYLEKCRFCIIFDVPHEQYESNFFSYIIKAYIKTKKSIIGELLKSPNKYNKIMDFRTYNKKYSIFEELNCEVEEEYIISRAVTEFFYCCYQIDINFISILSRQVYEGIANKCSIYIPRVSAGRGKRTAKLKIKLRERIDFNYDELRKIRKLMEIARNNLSLVLDRNKRIIGYTDGLPKKYEGKIIINGSLFWDFYLGKLILRYRDGVYRIVNTKENRKKYLFKNGTINLSREQKNIINKIITEAKKQLHGTTIIFGNYENCKFEANRLSSYNRGMLISPIDLVENINVIVDITSIDGALIVDFNGNCYALGVILDGDMEIKGKSERGARYNSAINYVERQKKQGKEFVVVIFSEDGMIDVYPN